MSAPDPEIDLGKIPIPPYAGYIGADGRIVPPGPEVRAEHPEASPEAEAG